MAFTQDTSTANFKRPSWAALKVTLKVTHPFDSKPAQKDQEEEEIDVEWMRNATLEGAQMLARGQVMLDAIEAEQLALHVEAQAVETAKAAQAAQEAEAAWAEAAAAEEAADKAREIAAARTQAAYDKETAFQLQEEQRNQNEMARLRSVAPRASCKELSRFVQTYAMVQADARGSEIDSRNLEAVIISLLHKTSHLQSVVRDLVDMNMRQAESLGKLHARLNDKTDDYQCFDSAGS